MVVGVLRLVIYLPENHSLKGKRGVLRKIKAQVANHFNVSISESDDQDLWQRATLGIVAISEARAPLESCFAQLRGLVESEIPGDLLSFQTEFLA